MSNKTKQSIICPFLNNLNIMGVIMVHEQRHNKKKLTAEKRRNNYAMGSSISID